MKDRMPCLCQSPYKPEMANVLARADIQYVELS